MKRLITLTTLVAAAALAACSDSAGPGGEPTVSLSFAGARPAPAAAPGFYASVMADTLTSGSDTLVITSAQLVLREIELERVDAVCDSTIANQDGCEEFEAGPLLVTLPLSGGVEQTVAITIPAGTYDEIEFEIHKVSSDDPEDAAFRAAHPDFVDISIRVQGTFNGQPFTFESDLNVDQEFDLVPPLVITDGTLSTNVTVLVDLSKWFVVGSQLVNPALGNKGEQYENQIKENIKSSIEAFEDKDKDGDKSDES